jgi:hypothetical protein
MHINFIYILVFILIYFGCHWILHRNKDRILSLLRNNKTKLKIVVTSIIASTLFLTPIAPIIKNGQIIGISKETAEAATLADVDILAGTDVEAELGNLEGPGDYTLDLKLEGTGLADVELVNPETTAVFYAPKLAGDLGEQATAEVRVEILPITMEDLPALKTLINTLTGTLNGLLSEVLGLVDDVLDLLPDFLLDVEGIEELEYSINALNNLDDALEDLLAYIDEIPARVNSEAGIITVEFSDGIDNHLNTAVKDVVLQLLGDIVEASQSLEINLLGLIGDLLGVNNLLNEIIDIATDGILPAVEGVITEITTGAVNLTGNLTAAQVIGNTTITVPLTISRTTDVSGIVPIDGGVVDANVVDLDVLSISDSSTAIVLPDTTPPEAPILYDVYESDRVIRGNGEANTTVRIVASNFETTGEVDEGGKFAIDIPDDIQSLEPNTTITVYLLDDAGNESEPTATSVIEEEFYLRVPERLMFEPTSIDGSTPLIPRQDPNWTIEMIDTRRPGSYFQILAQIEEPLTSESGTHQLPNALIYIDENNQRHVLSDESISILSGNSIEETVTEVNWTEDRGPMIEVDTGNVFATDYSTTITWTLADVPSGE